MSRKIVWQIVVPFCLVGALISPGSAQDAVLPVLVIEDASGDTLGPVVGFTSLNTPIIRFMDTAVDVPVFLQVVDDDHVQAAIATTYFSGGGCTGTAYHLPNQSFAKDGLAKMTGFAYSIARIGVDGPQWLFRSDAADTGTAGIEVQSNFFSSGDSCTNDANTLTLRAATAVLNLDAQHPPEYDLP